MTDPEDSLQARLADVNALFARHKLVEELVHRQEMQRHNLVENLVHKQNLAELEREYIARVLEAEHRIYPLALRLVAAGHIRVELETAHIDAPALVPPALVVPALKD